MAGGLYFKCRKAQGYISLRFYLFSSHALKTAQVIYTLQNLEKYIYEI